MPTEMQTLVKEGAVCKGLITFLMRTGLASVTEAISDDVARINARTLRAMIQDTLDREGVVL